MASESKSCPAASDALWEDGAVPKYMLLKEMMSMRDECKVKSGVQIVVFVGKRH